MATETRYTAYVTLSSGDVREYSHWFPNRTADSIISDHLERSYPEAVSIEFEPVFYTRPAVRRRPTPPPEDPRGGRG